MEGQIAKRSMVRCAVFILAGLVAGVPAAFSQQAAFSTPLLPLSEVQPGMRGVGRTVFDGRSVEEFDVEILGVLRNIAPRQSVILARLSGGPLERTGVMAGMSGSPVYIDGRLVGAVALAFQFSKEPIAGITPIEQMIGAMEQEPSPAGPADRQLAWRFEPEASESGELRVVAGETPEFLPSPEPGRRVFWQGSEASLARVGTPLTLSGFTAEAIQHFEPQLRSLGLAPVQGGSGAGSGEQTLGDASRLEPGSMISVQLVRGDMGVNADGTVTLVDQGRIFAFGHQFLSAGPTEIPFAESTVIAALPGYASSMKISTPGRLLGVIQQDRSSGVFGVLGQKARMIPIDLEVVSSNRTSRNYQFEVVNDRFLLPFLVNMTVFSALGATERMVGELTLQVEQTIALDGLPEVKLENLFSGPANAPAMAAQSAATSLVYLMQSGLGPLDVRNIRLKVIATNRWLAQELEQVWADKREVKAGEPVELRVLLRTQEGQETLQKITIPIPASLAPGPLMITVADGTTMDRMETNRPGRPVLPKNPQQLVRAINKSRRNNRLYVRLSRPATGFSLQGETFPSPPPSVMRTFSTDASLSMNLSRTLISAIADSELEPLPSVVTGFKNITITIKD